MGKDRQAEAQAAQAREMARQFDELRQRADQVSYDKEEVLANLKAASEQVPEIAGLYEAVLRDPSALEAIQTDPRFDEIMKGNLEAVQEMAEEGGFTEEDMAKRRALQRQVAADDQARQKSIVQDLMQRGQAGSGTELLARLGSSQASAQRAAESSDRLAMDSAAARRAAIAQASQQASGMQQQSFGQQAQKATAADQIAAFNAMQRQSAQDRNLQQRQQQENIKTQQQAQYYGNAAQTEQQRFANEMSKLGLQSNLVGQAGQARMAGVAPKSNLGGVIGTVAGAGLGAYLSGGSAQGTAAGASIGGATGSLFKDGGIRHKYADGLSSAQIAGRQAEADYANRGMSPYQAAMFVQRPTRTTGESFSTLTDKLGGLFSSKEEPKLQDETEIFGKSAFDDKKNQEVLNKDLGVKEVNGKDISGSDNAAALGALASVVGQMGKQSQRPAMPEFKPMQMNIPVQNTAQFQYADGGMKNDPDSMRDALLGEVQGFADGGVKCCSDEDENNLQELLKLELSKFEEGGVKDYSDERLMSVSDKRNDLLRQIRENEEMGNLRANNPLRQQLAPLEEEMIKNVEMGVQYSDGGVITPELEAAAKMLRTNNQPAPAAPMPGGQPPMPAPMPPQGMPMQAPQMPPMPPQGQMMADGGMAYEDGGEGTIIDSGMEMYEGDQLPDRINDGEMVLNVEQQDRVNDKLMELKRLKSKERTDKMLADGTAEINPAQQEAMMAFFRGEIDIDELPNDRVVKEPTIGEPTGRMAELFDMVSRKKRRG